MTVAELAARLVSFRQTPKTFHDLVELEVEVARWLRADEVRYQTLRKWIMGRVEGRGSAPPNNPHDMAVRAGQDWECRQIAARLDAIFAAPAVLDSEPET